jgi:hypothetical protein
MKKIAIVFSTLLLGAASFAQKTVMDPNVEERSVSSFRSIDVSHAFDVFLTQGNEEKVAVSASEAKYLENIKVEVRNGVLHIWWDAKGKWNTGNKKLKAYISFRSLEKIKASGACDLSIVGDLKANDLLVDLSGASDLKGRIEAKKLAFDMSGASDAKISGTAVDLNVDASGASSFKGFDVTAEYCNISASGASDIKITVSKELSATASGASDIKYKGSGSIRDVKSSGASSISRS